MTRTDTPGVSLSSAHYVSESEIGTDSVDADDGAIDGLGTGGRSLYANGVACTAFSCVVGAVFDFAPEQYPNAVGIVWTDGSAIDEFRFEAFDVNGALIGLLGPFHLGDDNALGGAGEDRFVGVFHAGGISRVTLTAFDPLASYFEMDHLQYGTIVPEPNALSLFLVSLGTFGALKLRRKRQQCSFWQRNVAVEVLEQRTVLSASIALNALEVTAPSVLSAILADHSNGILETSERGRAFLDNYAIEEDSLWVRAYIDPDCGLDVSVFKEVGLESFVEFAGAYEGKIDFEDVESLIDAPGIEHIEPILRPTFNAVQGQGDVALRSDEVRDRFSFDGSGVVVGVISDSFNTGGNASSDILAGELPVGAYAIHDNTGSDEGRAMMQIVHDIAPGADVAFSTGFPSAASFSTAINDLRGIDADVVVDDVTYWDMPFFQDGVPAQLVTDAVNDGVTYFTSAGNFGPLSRDDVFRPSSQSIIIGGTNYGPAHDFDPLTGPGHEDIFQAITLPANYGIRIALQWGEPFRSASGGTGATNNLEMLVFLTQPTSPFRNPYVSSTNANTVTGNAWESLVLNNPDPQPRTFYLAVTRRVGSTANLPLKYIVNDFGQVSSFECPMASQATVFGHANTQNGAAVGAAYYHYGSDFSPVLTPTLEAFSSRGGTPILFDTSGNPTSETRQQPMIVAPDGGNVSQSVNPGWVDTSVWKGYYPGVLGGLVDDADSDPNFFGTSAAAPHAAAVAALIKQAWSQSTPAQIYDILKTTATDYGTTGFDYSWGHGLIDALSAVYKAFKPGVPDLNPLDDTGISNTDNITNDPSQRITVTAPKDSYIWLYVNGTQVATWDLGANDTQHTFNLSLAGNPSAYNVTARVAENSSVPLANRSRPSDPLVLTVDVNGPRATGVTVRDATSGGNSYIIPTATNSAIQIQPVHLVNGVRSVEIAFGEDVFLPTPVGGQVAVELWDVSSGSAVQYTSATASEISPGVIRLTNNANITLSKLWVRIKSSEITDGLRDIAGNYLDGNWTNPTDYTDNTGSSAFGGVGSGNGTNGGTFDFKVNVSKGDTDGDLDIDLDDLNNVRNNFGGTGLGDTDWDGDVDLEDLNNVRNNFGFNANTWPVVPGASALMAGGGTPIVYGEERLREALRDYYYSRLTNNAKDDSFDDLLFWELLGDEEWWKVTLSE